MNEKENEAQKHAQEHFDAFVRGFFLGYQKVESEMDGIIRSRVSSRLYSIAVDAYRDYVLELSDRTISGYPKANGEKS